MGVIGLLANDHAIFNQNLVQAATATVMPASGGNPNPPIFPIGSFLRCRLVTSPRTGNER